MRLQSGLSLKQIFQSTTCRGFKPASFEFEPKAAARNLRLPKNLLDALKVKAQAKGIPYTRYVRLLLENDVAQV